MRHPRVVAFTRVGEVALATTALAPVCVVVGIRLFRAKDGPAVTGGLLIGLGVALLLASFLFVWIVRKRSPPQELIVVEQKPADKEVLGFVAAYVLPAVAFTVTDFDGWALAVATGFSLLILWRTDVLHVNPVVALQGYRFLEIQDQSGVGALLLTKDRTRSKLVHRAAGPAWRFDAVRLTDTVWLHTPRD